MKGIETIVVPEGFVCDGCSWVPDWGITYCCNTHDYIYRKGVWKGTRAGADRLLRRMIIQHGRRVGKPKRYWAVGWIYWAGVRLFGWYAWQRKVVKIKEVVANVSEAAAEAIGTAADAAKDAATGKELVL